MNEIEYMCFMCPMTNGFRRLPVFGSLWGSGRNEFLCVLLCLRVCGPWSPGQPGVWGISISTTELGQAAFGLRACVSRTPTVSNDVVIPSPVLTCFIKLPLCQVSGDIVHMAHIWVG